MTDSGNITARPMPRAGALLPRFELTSAGGGVLGPARYKGRRNLVLYFADSLACPECRRALRDFADRCDELREQEAEVLVVAPADQDRALQDRSALGLPFPVLADPDLAAHGLYGALTADGRAAAAVFVADRWGEIFERSAGTPDHQVLGADEVLSWLGHIEMQCPECGAPEWAPG